MGDLQLVVQPPTVVGVAHAAADQPAMTPRITAQPQRRRTLLRRTGRPGLNGYDKHSILAATDAPGSAGQASMS